MDYSSCPKEMIIPSPLFDVFSEFKTQSFAKPFPEKAPSVYLFLQEQKHNGCDFLNDYKYSVQFLLTYGRKSEQTYNGFRTEIERLLLWSWLIRKKTLSQLTRADLEEYVEFYMKPHSRWVSNERHHHFVDKDGIRQVNEHWRPFRIDGEIKSGQSFVTRNPAQSTIIRFFSSISVFFNHLVLEDYLDSNVIPVVKKHCPYLMKNTQIRAVHRLSELQWSYVLDTLTKKADEDVNYERNLFLVALMKSCYLRVSELSDRPSWKPVMTHFYRESGYVWLSVFGKGRKLRNVSVPEEMLHYLSRYRLARGLSQWPEQDEQEPLIHRIGGSGGLSVRQVARLVEDSFRIAVDKMKSDGFEEESVELSKATTHWLRHTGASMDLAIRPIKHISEDLGHASLATTDRVYVQSDNMERAESGRKRKV